MVASGWRTRVTFAFGGPTPQSRNNAFNQSQEWVLQPPGNHATACLLLRATLPCETALWLFHDVDRRRKLKGWPEPG